MTIKYEVHNQLTGLMESTVSFEEAKILRQRVRDEYLKQIVDPLFQITVLIQAENGSWTQTLADENGLPVPPREPTEEEIRIVDSQELWAKDENGNIVLVKY